ncbi:hypothetical protein PN441_04600 [Spirulina major CS-329]|nr:MULTISPECIES: hypothetical protein [Spirulina]MDB9494352.1 hypothetical protein [Spirulina subsalsa CS-330]MDB9502342.1 hypothetical protein [Spirulina major CS-329]
MKNLPVTPTVFHHSCLADGHCGVNLSCVGCSPCGVVIGAIASDNPPSLT